MAKVRIDIGCGKNKKPGFWGVDVVLCEGVDIVANTESNYLPFVDNSVREVYTSHVLEHVDDPNFVMEEIHRILVAGGKLTIRVPHYTWNRAYNPFHKRFFSYTCFDVYDETTKIGTDFSYLSAARFKIIKKEIRGIFSKKLPYTIIFHFLAKLFPEFYERFFSFISPAGEIYVELEKI